MLLLFADSACEKIIKATTTDLDPAADVLRMRYRRRRRRRHGPSDGHIHTHTHTQRCTSPLRWRRLFDSSTDRAAPIARDGSGGGGGSGPCCGGRWWWRRLQRRFGFSRRTLDDTRTRKSIHTRTHSYTHPY